MYRKIFSLFCDDLVRTRENRIIESPGLGKKSKSPIQASSNPDRFCDGGEFFYLTDVVLFTAGVSSVRSTVNLTYLTYLIFRL